MKFPAPETAHPSGLLAIGANLEVGTLVTAYQHGTFPWFNEGEPIQWWHPNPRMVLFPERFKWRRSLKKVMRNGGWRVHTNREFTRVIERCATIHRPNQNGTWITTQMMDAYIELHRVGYAHSIEIYHDDQLVGGLYGVNLGKVFFGESMFSTQSNASKVAAAALVAIAIENQGTMIDCQIASEHLQSLGAEPIERDAFVGMLTKWTPMEPFIWHDHYSIGCIIDTLNGIYSPPNP